MHSPQKAVPQNIKKYSDFEMQVDWQNGETSIIPFTEIRYQCRCAECVDEWTRVRRVRKESISKSIKPLKIEPVGRYAIQFVWSDGHKAGIYSYDLLYLIAKGQAESGEFSVKTGEKNEH